MLSATASLGMILLWDVDGGLTQIDKYLYSSDDYIKVLKFPSMKKKKKKISNLNEPPRGRTNNVVSEQVRHKSGCIVTEAGWKLEISDLRRRRSILCV